MLVVGHEATGLKARDSQKRTSATGKGKVGTVALGSMTEFVWLGRVNALDDEYDGVC